MLDQDHTECPDPVYMGPANARKPNTPEQIEEMSEAAREQREYERRRGVCMDEAVLITAILRQKIEDGPGKHVRSASPTASDMLSAAATIYAALVVAGAQ